MATDKKEWLLLSRSDGCISLRDLYFEYQYLNQKKTPQEIFIEIKKRHKKKQPLGRSWIILKKNK
jgi:hypothetical protein